MDKNIKNHKFLTDEGYWLIYSPNNPRGKRRRGYVFEHILVIEKHLGQKLTPGYVVHHIDINPNNNKFENLLLISSIAEHNRLHYLKKKDSSDYPQELKRLVQRQRKIQKGQINLKAELKEKENEKRRKIEAIILKEIASLLFRSPAEFNARLEKMLIRNSEKDLSKKVFESLYILNPRTHHSEIRNLIAVFRRITRPRNIDNLFTYIISKYDYFKHVRPIIQISWCLYHMLKEHPNFGLKRKHYILIYKNVKSSSWALNSITKLLINLPNFEKEKSEKVIDYLKLQGTPNFTEDELNDLIKDPFLEEEDVEQQQANHSIGFRSLEDTK